jgi:hypothetical protein
MDNPVYLDEDIPFVESGDYEIDDATGGGHGTATTLSHGNIISLNHQYHDSSIWTTNVPTKRGRRPKSTAVFITTTAEPKRRGRKPKQELLSPKKSIDSNKSNDILSESTDDIHQKQQRRSTAGIKSHKKTKIEEQQQQQMSGKLINFYQTLPTESIPFKTFSSEEREGVKSFS